VSDAQTDATPRRPDAPPISVVVASIGDSPELRQCLEQLGPQARGEDAEIVVVLNCAPEMLASEARAALQQASTKLLFEPRVGKSNALNRGIEASCGQVIAFTDDDAQPEAGWLASLCQPLLQAGAGAPAGCGGRVLPTYPDAPPPDWYRALVERKPTNFLGPRHDLGAEDRDYHFHPERWIEPIGANCAYRREVLAGERYRPELGPNRETGLLGGEDSELALRLLRQGHRLLYRADARVRHPVSAERMTAEYVARSYFMAGVVRVRVIRALDLAAPSRARARTNLMIGELRRRARQWVGQPALGHADFKQHYRRGLLAELGR
jgi:glycosyltransferase involved in cell wall biosynthesis